MKYCDEIMNKVTINRHYHSQDDGLMILCAICTYWQHGVCFKVLTEEEAPSHHICDVCADVSKMDIEIRK